MDRNEVLSGHEWITGWDHGTCKRCGWIKPDLTMKRGTAAGQDEWFPSLDAFEHFRSTGVRAWQESSPCEVRTSVTNEEVVSVLEDIANTEWVENCLDPQRSARLARDLLTRLQSKRGE